MAHRFSLPLLILPVALAACGGGGASSPLPATPAAPASAPTPISAQSPSPAPTATPTPTPKVAYRIAFLGDSWTWGVGVASVCGTWIDWGHILRPTMDSTPCPNGASITDDVARMLNAQAYQNLGLGGALTYDVLMNEVPLVDPTANLVIVNIGFNDEVPIAATEGATAATTSSFYNASFSEVPSDLPGRYAAIVAGIKARAPQAAVYLVLPAHQEKIPGNGYALDPNLPWADQQIDNAIRAQSRKVAGIIDLGSAPIYQAAYYDPAGGVCETRDVKECGSHPDEAGAAVIASVIAGGIH